MSVNAALNVSAFAPPRTIPVHAFDLRPAANDARLQRPRRATSPYIVISAPALLPFCSTQRHGSGLGLALTRDIIEADGGRISLQNREGDGLRVI